MISGKWYVEVKSRTNGLYYVACNPVVFTDVMPNQWYTENISKASAKRLINGLGDIKLNPEGFLTRAEFIQLIVNAVQLPESNSTAVYTDVSKNDWYYDAVSRAKAAGLMHRFSGDTLNPSQSITREEMASILAEVLRQSHAAIPRQMKNLNEAFADYSKMGSAFLEDIELVYRTELMVGINETAFGPDGLTTRAQAATVQMRLLEYLDMIDR